MFSLAGSKRRKLLKGSSKKGRKEAENNSGSEAGEETDEGDMESQEMDYFSSSESEEEEVYIYITLTITVIYT